mmetsp:Transcript_13417/g.44390  ORF Transcript_13417/g.44390 Transcript_13417/m.44390 type:complete len:252 (+) Transcript_13417:435-1190(+)
MEPVSWESCFFKEATSAAAAASARIKASPRCSARRVSPLIRTRACSRGLTESFPVTETPSPISPSVTANAVSSARTFERSASRSALAFASAVFKDSRAVSASLRKVSKMPSVRDDDDSSLPTTMLATSSAATASRMFRFRSAWASVSRSCAFASATASVAASSKSSASLSSLKALSCATVSRNWAFSDSAWDKRRANARASIASSDPFLDAETALASRIASRSAASLASFPGDAAVHTACPPRRETRKKLL